MWQKEQMERRDEKVGKKGRESGNRAAKEREMR
jgi:hypothetical protein